MRDRQMTGFQNQAQSALYAADAGVADALDILRTETVVGAALYPGDCLAHAAPRAPTWAAAVPTRPIRTTTRSACSSIGRALRSSSTPEIEVGQSHLSRHGLERARAGERARWSELDASRSPPTRCHAYSSSN